MNSSNIRFNPLKHHLDHIRKFAKSTTAYWQDDLLSLGHLAFDIYTGHITMSEIECEVLQILKDHGVTDKSSYLKFIGSINNYKLITLSDSSSWILRWGTDSLQFIHLHPARFGKNIIRVRASTLKTAIALVILLKNNTQPDLFFVNQTRNTLQLSVINSKGMDKIISIFQMVRRGDK